MTNRFECKCVCHQPDVKAVHVMPCCTPDPTTKEEQMNIIDLKVGDKISYRGSYGLDPLQEATIESFGRKNGKSLVYLDDGHWAYVTQIDAVISG